MTTQQDKWINIFFAFEAQVSGLLIRLANQIIEVHNLTPFLDFEASKNGFLTTLDDILSRFYQATSLEVKETVFVLSQDWLVANELTPSRKEILKLAKKELSLEVNGFVVLEEALSHAWRQKTLSPPSFLFFTLLDKQIHLTRIELGRVSEHLSIGRSDDLLADMAEALSRLKNKVQPLHVIIAAQDPQKIQDRLKNAAWKTEFGFPQTPQLEFLNFQELMEKILLVIFKNQKEVRWLTQVGESAIKTTTPMAEAETPLTPPSVHETIPKPGSNMSDLEEKNNDEEATPQEDKDKFLPPDKREENQTDEVTELERMGIILNPDEASPPLIQEEEEKTSIFSSPLKLPSLGSFFQTIPASLVKLKPTSLRLPSFSFSIGRSWLLRLILFSLPFLIIPLALGLSYFFFFKAKIVITPRSESLHKSIEVTFSDQVKTADYQNFILPAKTIQLVLTKKAETPTTGTTETGDPGKGKIIIYNYTSKPRIFLKGDLLYLANDPGKKLKLDERVEVASKSSQKNEDGSILTIPGKAEAAAETTFWGEEANLKKGTQLYFSHLDKTSYSAKVSQDFQGGKKYQVKSVSQDDIDKLKEEIKNQINQNLDQLLKNKLAPGEKIINSSLSLKYLQNKLSSELNQPAEKVSLESKVQISVLTYNQADVETLVNKILQQTVPHGFQVDKNNISWKFTPEEDNKYKLELNIPLKWSFNKETIQANLAGKDLQSAIFYLQNLPGVFAFQISFQPPVPKILQRLPYRKSNILVLVGSK